MIERVKYLNQLINTKNNGFPKVITGIRRCGKSYLLKDIYTKYLKEESVQIPPENWLEKYRILLLKVLEKPNILHIKLLEKPNILHIILLEKLDRRSLGHV